MFVLYHVPMFHQNGIVLRIILATAKTIAAIGSHMILTLFTMTSTMTIMNPINPAEVLQKNSEYNYNDYPGCSDRSERCLKHDRYHL